MRVQMSYHRFNNLDELLNIDLAAKLGRVIPSKDLMDRECNCYLPSKVNGKCVYEGKFQSIYLIYELKCSMCDAIYIGNTYLLRLLKNGQKSDSFAAHFEQQFNTTSSRTYLRKYMVFIVVKQINPISAMK